MAKITIQREVNFRGDDILILKKARGTLSMEEITEFLQRENNGLLQGHYAIFINATDSSVGGSGWGMEETPKGDVVELVLLTGEESCPVCNKMLSPDYCPECGTSLTKLK